MTRFVVGDDRSQSTLFPERLEDYLSEDNPVRAIDVFVDDLDLAKLGFGGVEPEATGRPAYHPGTLLKIYVYGYLNRVQSSRRLERECQRNIELVWLTGRLMPDFKTIADFRKDNGEAIRKVCREFVMLCRRLELFSEASVAIDAASSRPSTHGTGTSPRPRCSGGWRRLTRASPGILTARQRRSPGRSGPGGQDHPA
jgi:transposase